MTQASPLTAWFGMRGRWAAALVVVALSLLAASHTVAAPTFPPLNGQRVVDDAHVLTPETQADLTSKLAALEQKTGDQVVVVTLPNLQGMEIEDYGYQLGRAWGIGQKGKNTGALFIIAPSEHKVRIEVGYGLEPVLTDGLSSVILQTQVLPKFHAGDINGGVEAGTDAIIQQLGLDPQTAQANAQAAEHRPAAPPLRIPIFLIIIGVFFVVRLFMGGGRGGGGGLWALPFLFMGGGGGYRGGYGGGDGGGFGGGGGFSGGGGSFGGGGASGGW
jgi:uncharacterized protein